MSYAFISYGSKDRDIVNPIKDILVANGIKTWVAPDDIPAGSNGLVILPNFAGERCPINDAQAKGMIFGLTLEHTRDHIYHAALEGIAFCIAQNIKVMEELNLP